MKTYEKGSMVNFFISIPKYLQDMVRMSAESEGISMMLYARKAIIERLAYNEKVQKLLLDDLESNPAYYEVKNAIVVINRNKEEHQKAIETIVKAIRFKFGKGRVL